MRGKSWQYLIDWALITFIIIVIIWFVAIITTLLLKKIKKHYTV